MHTHTHTHSVMSILADPYSQASLTFVDIGLEYGADTQGLTDFDNYEFTLPSQTQTTQSQTSQPTEQGNY